MQTIGGATAPLRSGLPGKPDGYRVLVEVDDAGTVRKRLEIDPSAWAAIELIFRRALAGKRTARSLGCSTTEAG